MFLSWIYSNLGVSTWPMTWEMDSTFPDRTIMRQNSSCLQASQVGSNTRRRSATRLGTLGAPHPGSQGNTSRLWNITQRSRVSKLRSFDRLSKSGSGTLWARSKGWWCKLTRPSARAWWHTCASSGPTTGKKVHMVGLILSLYISMRRAH